MKFVFSRQMTEFTLNTGYRGRFVHLEIQNFEHQVRSLVEPEVSRPASWPIIFVVVRYESAPNFVVDDCKDVCNFTFVVIRFESASNFVVVNCKVVCNLTFVVMGFESAPNFVVDDCKAVCIYTFE